MRRFTSACLAAASALICTGIADAARPRYGGTLRIETSAVMRSLNPAAAALDSADALARRWLHPLIFETLVAPASGGGLRPMLAIQWDRNAAATQWRFQLRSGIRLHDGSPLDASRVAAALRTQGRPWTITSDSVSVTIEMESADPDLPWLLTDVRSAIAFARPGGGEPIGTGPFAIERWEPRRLLLRAHDDHWAGRPFVDAVQVDMGRTAADQARSLDLGRADLVSVEPHAVRPLVQRGMRVAATRPIELIAIVFPRTGRAPVSRELARGLSLAIDRAAMSAVLLQRYAEPASTVLPDWIGGYASLLRTDHDTGGARSIVSGIARPQRAVMLRSPAGDGLLRAIAERVAVDAREAGLAVAVVESGASPAPAQAHLVRVRLEPATREIAIRAAVAALGPQLPPPPSLTSPAPGASLDEIVRFERGLAESGALVPLVHLSEVYATAPAVETWLEPLVQPTGRWSLESVWLKAVRP